MKTIIKYVNVLFDMIPFQPSMDRLSLHEVSFCHEQPVSVDFREIQVIPENYLFYQIHEIEDEAWQHYAGCEPDPMGKAVGM